MKERITRRSSGILKRVLSEEMEINDDQTDETKFVNPSQKQFSKRVSFADTNQIKEIARVQDIKQDWHDSTSSSEEGLSRLADISNLTTPTIRKLQQKRSGGDSKALQNLLKGTIIAKGKNKLLNETQGSCAMDISAAVSTSGLSFFDNSKLGFGGTESDDSETPLEMRNPDEKEDVDLTLSFYTKDFLRSLELDRASDEEKAFQNDTADENRYPHINPPSYKECVESAGLKPIVSSMKSKDSCVNSDNGEKKYSTCAVQSVAFNQENSSEMSQEKISTNADADMEFTCVLQPLNMAAQAESKSSDNDQSEGAVDDSTVSGDGGDDMGLTCVVLQQDLTCKPEVPLGSLTSGSDMPDGNNEEMDFTECVTSYMDRQKNNEDRVMAESCSTGGHNEDEIEFTCMVPLGNAAQSHQIIPDSGKTKDVWDKNAMINDEMDFTEVVKTREWSGSSLEKKFCIDECTNDDDVDLTCAGVRGCAEEIESRETCQMGAANIPLSHNEDIMGEANFEVVQNGRSTHDESVMDFTCVTTHEMLLPDESTQTIEPNRNTSTDIPSTAPVTPLEVSKKPPSSAQQNEVRTVQHGEPEIFVLDTQPDNNMGSGESDAEKNIAIAKESAAELLSDPEEITFASPLKKSLSRKIRNSIGLYKATLKKKALGKRGLDPMLESENKSESASSAGEIIIEEDGIVCAKRPKSTLVSYVEVPESQEANLVRHDHSKLSISMDVSAQEGVFLPDARDDMEDTFEIPETQDAKQQSPPPVDHFSVHPTQSDNEIMCGSARSELSVEDCGSTTDVAVLPDMKESSMHIEKRAPSIAEESLGVQEPEHSHHEGQTKALGLSIALDKSLMDDIRRIHSTRKEENITVQEFLCDYAEINMGNFKKSRHSIIVPSMKPQAPTSLAGLFEANYWIPREVCIRETCVELMRNKIEWLEKSVSDLEGQLNTSNPEIFNTIRNNHDEISDLLSELKKLSTNCKTLGNVYWKRDAMKLFKGLNKEMNTYIDGKLLPVTQQLDPSKELLDKALREIEQENHRLDKALQGLESEKFPPSSDQAASFQGLQTELDVLSARQEELLSTKSSAEKQKCEIRERRRELLNKIIDDDFMISKPKREKRLLQESLATLQKSSEWKLQKVASDSLVFSFVNDSITFTALFEEDTSWEWTRKIKSYSLKTNAAAGEIMPFDAEFYALIHTLWKRVLVLPNLAMEYSNLSGLKNVLEVLSNLSRASKELIADKDWVNCRLVCEACASAQDSLITVSFLPPKPGIDGFNVKFTFECDASETSGSKLDCILQTGFVPTSSVYVPGNRVLDHLGKGDVKRVLESVEPGRHCLRRAVDGLLKKIEYQF